jgi:hypothetical protein
MWHIKSGNCLNVFGFDSNCILRRLGVSSDSNLPQMDSTIVKSTSLQPGLMALSGFGSRYSRLQPCQWP